MQNHSFLALVFGIAIALGVIYLITVGLTSLVLWGFSIDISAWKAGVGVMASMILLGGLFSRGR